MDNTTSVEDIENLLPDKVSLDFYMFRSLMENRIIFQSNSRLII